MQTKDGIEHYAKKYHSTEQLINGLFTIMIAWSSFFLCQDMYRSLDRAEYLKKKLKSQEK